MSARAAQWHHGCTALRYDLDAAACTGHPELAVRRPTATTIEVDMNASTMQMTETLAESFPPVGARREMKIGHHRGDGTGDEKHGTA